MNKNLLLEVKGRSMELLAYAREKLTMRTVRSELVAFHTEGRRKGLTPKQMERGLKAITAKHYGSDDDVLDDVAQDVISNLKLAEKHLD